MKLSQFSTPITEAFSQAKLAYGAGWGGFAAAAGAIALFAPAALSNDDRGYGRTALITTPVVGAGFAVAPGIWKGLRGAGQDLKGFFDAKPFDVKDWSLKFKSLTDLRDLREAGQLTEDQFRSLAQHLSVLQTKSALDYFSAPGMIGKPSTIDEMHQSVMDSLAMYRDDEAVQKMAAELGDSVAGSSSLQEGIRRDLTMGIFESKLRASSPTDRLIDPGMKHAPLESLSFDEIEKELMDARSLDEEEARTFYENMQHRMATARNHAVGPEVILNPAEFTAKPLETLQFGAKQGAAYKLLSGQHSTMAEKIQEAVKNGWVNNATLHIDNGNAVGLTVNRGKESFSFGFVNEAGIMRTGNNFGIAAAARQVLDERGRPYDLDSWLVHNLDPAKASFKDLKQELASFAIYSGRHEDSYMAGLLNGLDSSTSFLPDAAKRRRSNEAGYSRMNIFGGRNLEQLNHEERVALVQQAMATGHTKLGGESSLKHLVFNTADEEQSVLGQLPPLNATDFTFRSETKPLHLAAGSIPSDLRGSVETQAVLDRWGGAAPTVRMNVAGVTPQQKTLFGYLPENVSDLRRPDVEREALNTIASDIKASKMGLTEEEISKRSQAAWEALRTEFEANPTKLASARKLGSLGEGDILLHNKYAAVQTEEMGIAHVKRLHVDPQIHGLGSGVRPFGPNQVIGFDATGSAVRSAASENWITGMQFDKAKGMWNVNYLRREHLETGSKLDILGRKGLAVMNESGEMEAQTSVLNMLYEKTGRGRPIMNDIDALANITSLHAKTKAESFRAMMGNTADVLKRIMNPDLGIGPHGYVDTFIAEMDQLGMQWDFDRQGFTELSDMVASNFKTDAAKAARMQSITHLAEELFSTVEGVTGRLHSNDPLFVGYRSAKQAGLSNNLMEYMHYFNQTGDAWVWDNTRRDIPHQVKMTFDMKSELYRSGEHEILRELSARAKPMHGSTREAWEFLEKFQARDFNTPIGDPANIKKIEDLGELSLASEGAFAGTILDPTNPETRKNWSIDLGEEREFVVGGKKERGRYLHVRGSDSYKGAANAYGVGDLATTDYQKSLVHTIEAARTGDPNVFAAATSKYADEIYGDLMGKGGIFRPDEIYPHGIARAIQTRPSQNLVAEGVHNPFEVVISRSRLHEIHDESTVQKLLKGEDVYAAAARNPVSAVPLVKVRLAQDADHMGPNMVGIDEGIRSLLQADDDKDILNLMFLKSEESIARAKKAIEYSGDFNQMSEQWRSVRTMELLQGNLEDSARITTVKRGTLAENIQQTILDVAAAGRGKNVEQRLVHSATGAYSNLLTNLYMNMDVHPTLRWSKDRPLAEKMMWLTRQVPISAGKGKMFLGDDPMQIYNEFFQGLRADNLDEGVRLAQDAVTKIAVGSGFETMVRTAEELEEINKIFGVNQKTQIEKGKIMMDEAGQMIKSKLAVGDTFNLYAETMLSGKGGGIIDEFVRGRNRTVDPFITALTKGEVTAEQGSAWLNRMGHSAAPYLVGAHLGIQGEANAVSTALGTINDVLRGAMGKVSKSMLPALPILAAGFGVAAIAGLMATPIDGGGGEDHAQERERRVQESGNRHRPEERIGTPDRVPGEPVEGSASNRPNVRVLPAPSQTKTAVVVPMQRSSELEVRASAPSRDAAAETSRLIQRMSSGAGPSNVTVNHVGGWKDAGSKLRRKEQLREQLDRNQQY